MILLILFAFLAGVVTVLSPCILPLLPIILSSADGSGKQKPIGVVVGFVASFTFFTLFLSSIVRVSGIPADSLRFFSIVVLAVFGLSLLVPQILAQIERAFSRLASLMPTSQNKTGFFGGMVIGLSLGLLWTPCVGPILASVISLAITGTVTAQSFIITLSYALGTAIPMFMIILAGTTALQKVPWLVQNTGRIQKAFGILMVLTAVGIYLNLDRRFQTFILTTFPNYGVGLTRFEDNSAVKRALEQVSQEPMDETLIGKPLSDSGQSKGVPAAELIEGGEWFNSSPLQLSELKDRVVLIDFWTYSCINCQRTLPYLKDWWAKYQDKGLVIIGVHSPEFEFEKSTINVQKAISDFGIKYPVMQDNDFQTWRAYNNRYWPAKYLIDKNGRVRYTHFGEGKYDETEEVIQELLSEIGADVSQISVENPEYQIKSRTPELYLGYDRIEYLASPEKILANSTQQYSLPAFIPNNHFAYAGIWSLKPEYSSPRTGAQLELKYEAKDVFLVARTADGTVGRMRITLDGEVLKSDGDVVNGEVMVSSDRLYHLVKLPQPGKHTLNIEFLDDGIEVYAFTFG